MRWIPGLTLKDHWDLKMTQETREWQARREDADREWRERQADKDAAWKEKESKGAERRHRWDLILTAGVATLILAVSQLWGSCIQATATREAAPVSNVLPAQSHGSP